MPECNEGLQFYKASTFLKTAIGLCKLYIYSNSNVWIMHIK